MFFSEILVEKIILSEKKFFNFDQYFTKVNSLTESFCPPVPYPLQREMGKFESDLLSKESIKHKDQNSFSYL